MSIATFTSAGVQGVRLSRKKQIIKGVPRIAGTHTKQTYWLFRDLNAEIGPGQVVAMLSRDPERSAAAMRVWAGLLPLDEGGFTAPARATLVSSPQGRWVRELSVEQTIRVVAGIYGMNDREVDQIVPAVARTAHVDSMLHWPIENLQKGYRAQIAFAIGVHAPTDLVMFDYTAFVGNRDFRPLCLDLLRAMRDAGKAVVVATDKPQLVLEAATDGLIVRGKRSQRVSVAEAAEFLIKDRVKGRRKARRRAEEDDDDGGLDF
jgi:ABC-type polysaccharide/polyol phosphate transport system ATPase subunit